MCTDFRDAAERHWHDGGTLFSDDALANADHLFGLSAECALKAVMEPMGMTLNADGKPSERRYRIHINDLWNEFHAFTTGRIGERYISMLSMAPNPFSDWDINQRYHHRTAIPRQRVQRHREAAMAAMTILQEAILDGEVS